MSRNRPYQNRLEELFSSAEQVPPEPVKTIAPKPVPGSNPIPGSEPVLGSVPVSEPQPVPGSETVEEVVRVSYTDTPSTIDQDLSRVLEIGQALTQAQNLARLLDEAASMIRERFGLNSVYIYLNEPAENRLVLRGTSEADGKQLNCEELALPLLAAERSSREQAFDLKGGFGPSTSFGLLVMQSARLGAFTTNRRLIFDILASRLAAAIEHIRLYPDVHDPHVQVVHETDPQTESGPSEARIHMGWDEFLDAINRKENIGYSYEPTPADVVAELSSPLHLDGADIVAGTVSKMAAKMGSKMASDEVLTTPLQVGGGETIGMLLLERNSDGAPSGTSGQPSSGDGHQAWERGEVDLVKSVADRIAQHLENLRLLAQAERYRTEAEEAARRLTREGWEAYLVAPQAPQSGYVYNLDEVKPWDEGKALSGNGSGDPSSDQGQSSDPASEPANQTKGAIKVRDELIGEVAVDDMAQDDELAAGILAVVTDRLGAHIENLRLLEETERSRQQLDKRAAELETVARVSTAAATILSPQELLQSVVDLTKYSFNLYHTHVYLLDDDDSTLALKAGAGKIGHRMVSEGEKIDMRLNASVAARAAMTRTGVVVNDVRLDENFLPHPLLPDALSELAVPMIVGDQLVGVFDVLASATNRFSDEDLRTFNTLAAQVAVALRNAELYAEQMATVVRLRELDHLKSSFLANMSHELRTPLNSILGFAQVILEELDGPLTPDMSNDLGLIEKNGKHLLNLINEVLDMAKIEAGRLSLSPEPVNLRSLLEDVLESSASLVRDKSLYLRLENPEKADTILMLDYTRMRQVFINLLGNASKFTERGGVTVEFEKQANKISVHFKDTGIGIPPNKLDMIFEQFSQVDTSTTRKAGGTGLGLPISRRLVELHGGRLFATSTGISGEGSVFTVELPITTAV